MENTLKESPDDWKICYFHHPIYSDGGRHGSEVELRVTLEPLFVKYGVNVVFSGHDHIYERIKPQKGITYFVAGAAASCAKGDVGPSAETAAYFDQDQAFMLVEIAGDELFFPGRVAHRPHRRLRRHPPATTETSEDVMRHQAAAQHLEHAVTSTHDGAGRRSSAIAAYRALLDRFLLLPLGAAIALVWANTRRKATSRSHRAIVVPRQRDRHGACSSRSATQEIVEAAMPGGALHSWRRGDCRSSPQQAASSASVAVYLTFVNCLRPERAVTGHGRSPARLTSRRRITC